MRTQLHKIVQLMPADGWLAVYHNYEESGTFTQPLLAFALVDNYDRDRPDDDPWRTVEGVVAESDGLQELTNGEQVLFLARADDPDLAGKTETAAQEYMESRRFQDRAHRAGQLAAR